MTERFSPPGDGWVEGPPPADRLHVEVVTYRQPGTVREWHRKIVPPLPTEPGYYITEQGWVWNLDRYGRWSSAATGGTLTTEYVQANGPFTRLVPEEEHRRQVTEEIRAVLAAKFQSGYGATRTLIGNLLDGYLKG